MSIKPNEPQPLYPHKDSLNEVVQSAAAQLPISNINDLSAILMTYHNTLLFNLQEKQDESGRQYAFPL